MKTAVEWYNQQIVDRQNGNGDSRSRDEIFEQALEMEKEIKEKEFFKGLNFGINIPNDMTPSQYYNQTFKQQEQ